MADQLQGAVDKAKSFKVQDLTTYVRNLTKDPPTLATIQPRVLEGIQVQLMKIPRSMVSFKIPMKFSAVLSYPHYAC